MNARAYTANQLMQEAIELQEQEKNPVHAEKTSLPNLTSGKDSLPEGCCHVCGKQPWHDRAGYGFIVRECMKCERPTCENCCECDYDVRGDPPAFVCTQWDCRPCIDNANMEEREAKEDAYWRGVNRTAYVTSPYNTGEHD